MSATFTPAGVKCPDAGEPDRTAWLSAEDEGVTISCAFWLPSDAEGNVTTQPLVVDGVRYNNMLKPIFGDLFATTKIEAKELDIEERELLADGTVGSGQKTYKESVLRLGFDAPLFDPSIILGFKLGQNVAPSTIAFQLTFADDFDFNNSVEFTFTTKPNAGGSISHIGVTSAIPLPAGAWLMLSGIGALGAVGYRRRKKAS